MIKAGVIGWPIAQSKSPIIHNYWLRQNNIAGQYEKIALAPDDFAKGVADLMAQGYAGVNVTIPHKLAALQIAHHQSARATAIGAANTLVFKDGEIHADNTDGYGFISNIMQTAPDWNAGAGAALILGAGGAARAVINSLLDAGVPEIIIANRTRSKAQMLADHFGPKLLMADWADAPLAAGVINLLVNTSALGMINQPELEFDTQQLRADCLVSDIVYNPLETKLLRNARAHGCQTVDGLGMLLHQAAPGFQAWFGVLPQVDAGLRTHVLNA